MAEPGSTIDEGFEWQVGIWDRIADLYLDEVDQRFVPVVEGVMERAALQPGEHVLDLGCGTGAVALQAAALVGAEGRVVGTDISADMLSIAGRRAADLSLANLELKEGRAEAIPLVDATFDVVLASLSLMYVIDRDAAAREITRVLRPGGRLVAAVWAGAEECDIVLFQQTAGSFAPPPPVPRVGPGALADTDPFLRQLAEAGIDARVELAEPGFEFADFDRAWEVLAGVTTAQLPTAIQEQAKQAVRDLMWEGVVGSRWFRNKTQFIVGQA